MVVTYRYLPLRIVTGLLLLLHQLVLQPDTNFDGLGYDQILASAAGLSR